jgi:serine/threonine protein kinase
MQTEATSAIFAGTYRWTAPELLDDSDSRPTQQSDVWAFGGVCYQVRA